MLARLPRPLLSLLLLVTCPLTSSLAAVVYAQAAPSSHITKKAISYLGADTPSPEEGPPVSADALRDFAYLPAQIGGIVGAYAVSLVLVAITLLSLAKKRREHLNAGNDEVDFEDPKGVVQLRLIVPDSTQGGIPNFSYPSPARALFGDEIDPVPYPPYIYPSPDSAESIRLPGVSPFVDPRVVEQDRAMAQQQLEEMYKHVMEHEEAKQKGVSYEPPVVYPGSQASRPGSLEKVVSKPPSTSSSFKKSKSKPASLNLSSAKEEKSSGSRTASLLSALRSPKKKSVKGISISSPIMTPQSATFPPHHHDTSSMASIAPRHYAPPPPPPVPSDQGSVGVARTLASAAQDVSPESVQSIDERIGAQLDACQNGGGGGRAVSQAITEPDPESAVSEHSQVPLVGLPSSPKPGATFPSLPSSPKPGATFQRPNAPSAVRTGGALPLRAYEPALTSPSATTQTTKQTVFERKGPLSPMGARTPGTVVPYSPYQPYTPLIPVTPSLVTKEDRKRMRKMVPKTPTLEMVKSSDDIW